MKRRLIPTYRDIDVYQMEFETAMQPPWSVTLTTSKTTMTAMRVDMGNFLSPHYLITLILIQSIGANL
jgi:hypothetical protein